MIFLFGIVIGLLFAIIFFMVALWAKPITERYVRQAQSKIKEKGAIIEPENEEINNWVESLPKE